MPSRSRPILVVDDDPDIRRLVSESLRREGFDTREAASAREARPLLADRPALVVLDIVLPEESGFDLLRELRRRSRVPVILLTGRSDEGDRIKGLDLGADDYVVKPFSPGELAARVRSVLRRTAGALDEELRFDGLTIEPASRQVTVAAEIVTLTRREYDLLEFLASRPGQVFTRDDLLAQVWASSGEWQDPATVTEHVRRLRLKLEPDPARPQWIKTIRGSGYLFDAGSQSSPG